jgi:hypothetical protein
VSYINVRFREEYIVDTYSLGACLGLGIGLRFTKRVCLQLFANSNFPFDNFDVRNAEDSSSVLDYATGLMFSLGVVFRL